MNVIEGIVGKTIESRTLSLIHDIRDIITGSVPGLGRVLSGALVSGTENHYGILVSALRHILRLRQFW